jgi:hypothetical protein
MKANSCLSGRADRVSVSGRTSLAARHVRSMLPAQVTVTAVLLALTSCANTGPAIYSHSTTVSRADIQTAIDLVQ